MSEYSTAEIIGHLDDQIAELLPETHGQGMRPVIVRNRISAFEDAKEKLTTVMNNWPAFMATIREGAKQ